MPRIDVSEEGVLILSLDDGEAICVTGGGRAQALSPAAPNGLAAALARAVAPEVDGRPPLPRALASISVAGASEETPLSVSEAITAILNAFQQVNVKMREARGKLSSDDAAALQVRNALQTEAMNQVVAICRRYLLARERADDPPADRLALCEPPPADEPAAPCEPPPADEPGVSASPEPEGGAHLPHKPPPADELGMSASPEPEGGAHLPHKPAPTDDPAAPCQPPPADDPDAPCEPPPAGRA